ncbi:uncharacterized protein LOC128207858 [Mya arenaria]|uniref:uncharacterized protein LOC128207858 n=1 Tax=Mya arenaria TaxID=6604 RepID=UPI0022E6893B|nr:uncharacterized protein LOC128207858 [Mya arenaria]
MFLMIIFSTALRSKRSELIFSTSLILQDKASPHKSKIVKELLEGYGWEVLDHLPYSPDLSVPDFDMFPKLKEPLRGIRYDSLDELECAVNGLRVQTSAISDLKEQIKKAQSTEDGSAYTRWGKSSCPGNGTETIYTELVAGAHYTHKGGAANYLCLTQQPSWNKYNDEEQAGGLVYGAEYEINFRSRQHFFGREITDEDPPCAVCRTERPTVIMIPGSRQCLDGWTMEYHGYLSSGFYGHDAASEYVCLDVDPEAILGGTSDNDGKLFYLTEVRCGASSLCPPYVNGRELTCVVCSK